MDKLHVICFRINSHNLKPQLITPPSPLPPQMAPSPKPPSYFGAIPLG